MSSRRDRNEDDVPEVPDAPVPSQSPLTGFVTMDAAMLAAQTEHVKNLTESIQQLAVAVRERPTKRQIQRQRRRTYIVGTAMVAVAAILFGLLFVQNGKLHKQCEDRNQNAIKFRILLEDVLAQPPRPGVPVTPSQIKLEKEFRDYKDSLKRIKC